MHHFGDDEDNLTTLKGGNYISKKFAENRMKILKEANGDHPKSTKFVCSYSNSLLQMTQSLAIFNQLLDQKKDERKAL